MEYLPKYLAYKFRWFSNASILRLYFFCMCAVIVLPFSVPLLIRINSHLVLAMLGIYLFCLVGILSAQYYSRLKDLSGIPKPHDPLKHVAFMVLVYLFLCCSLLLIMSPLIEKIYS